MPVTSTGPRNSRRFALSKPVAQPAPCPLRQKIAVCVLSILLAVTTIGWIVTATRDRTAPPAAAPQHPGETEFRFVGNPPTEMVEVLVAAKDLPVGTVITKEDIAKFVERKRVPKDSLPPAFVVNEEDLVGKRLNRAILKHETFNPAALVKGGVITLPEGYDLISLPVSSQTAGFVGPGSKVDVLASVREGKKIHVFPLLVDMLVLAVDSQLILNLKDNSSPTVISLAVTEKQALLLALAKQRGCHLEIL